jgi:hypothetical protein
MSHQPQESIVRIKTDTGQAGLSKLQKEFNRLTQKIEATSVILHDLREVTHYVQQRMQADYWPLVRQYALLRADLVRLFDRAYDRNNHTGTERKKLANLIRTISFELISEYGVDSLKPIYDKYSMQAFDQSVGVNNISMYEPEKTTDPESDETQRQQQRASKPKSAKRQEREEKQQADERNSTKAVRSLYVDLVKAFHPDREPDDVEKQRKTEIMHRVTEAYEKSDLLDLLRLQLEFDRIDQTHLETLAETQLRYYNKILRQQAQELDDEYSRLQNELAALTSQPPSTVPSRIGLEFSLNSDIAQLKRDVKQLKTNLKILAEPGQLQQWLKMY